MKKLKVMLVTVLVFMMSAQTVLGAAVPGTNVKERAGRTETAVSEGQLSENELCPEAILQYQREVYLNNVWDMTGKTLRDINGAGVNMNGEAKSVKIFICGELLDGSYTVGSMQYLDYQFAQTPNVKIVAIDLNGTALATLKAATGGYGLSKTVIASTNDNTSENAYWAYVCSILTADQGENWDKVYLPVIYVVDSNNKIRYISAGYGASELASLVNYIKGMDEVTGIDEIRAFVTRLYAYALGRQPDTNGLNDWVTRLMNKQITGTTAAIGFFDSDELKNRNLNNAEYVELLYKVMMNRSSDPDGKSYWVNLLNNGVSRMGVFNGFAGSVEFANICKSYGIDKGTATPSEGRDRNYGATQFVARLYTQALGRGYDINGLNDWCNRIVDKTWSVTDVSTTGFFNSREFLNKNLNNEEYVKVLYRTFLGREYDEGGLKDWVGKLNSGEMNRDDVLKGFSYSREFSNIMKQYGL